MRYKVEFTDGSFTVVKATTEKEAIKIGEKAYRLAQRKTGIVTTIRTAWRDLTIKEVYSELCRNGAYII